MSRDELNQEPPEEISDSHRDGRSLFLSLVNSIPACFIRKDRDGRIVFVNDNFAGLFGKGADEIVGRTIADFYPKEFAELAREEDEDVMRSGQVLEDVFDNIVNGKTVYYASRKGPVRNERNEVIGIQTIFWDITEQRLAEQALIAEREELRAAKNAADEANRAKSDFVANMSHEIRTPMNAIIGMTDLLLDSELTQTQREYLKMVQESGEALLTLINDILDFSKIEAGKFELQLQTFDIHELLGDTMKGMGFRAHTQGLELVFHVDENIPKKLIGDPGRIRQIVVNLVGNAIKFTGSGEVLLEITCKNKTESHADLLISVIDTGIGIAKENWTKVFKEFEQADASTTRKFGGTGLGLAISSRLVELMNGRIWVESELGAGSKFQIELSLGIDQSDSHFDLPTSRIDVQGVRVLIVDDNATNRRILKDMLSKWGMNPTTMSGGDAALTALMDAAEEGDSFQLIISDVNMPGMDGLTLAKSIVEKALLNPANVIMLTSGPRPEDSKNLRSLGISLHLLKPAKQSELYDAVVSSLHAVGIASGMPTATANPVNASAHQRELNVLLAEDNLVNQKLAIGILDKLGHRVTVANDGIEALALVEQNDFDLVLMDVQMPEMDGLEATRELRRRESGTEKHLLVVAMTAHAMKGDRESCLKAGMDDYLGKPIRIKDMTDKISELFHGSSTSQSPDDLASSPSEDVIVWSEALSSVGGDKKLLCELVQVFLKETPGLLQKAVDAADVGDTEALRAAIHPLKGSMLFLNPNLAMESSEEVEQFSTDGDLDASRQSLAALQGQFDQVCDSLKTYLKRANGNVDQ